MATDTMDARKERWRQQVLGTGPPEHLFRIIYDPEAPERPLPWPDRKGERVEWAWQLYLRQCERAEWLRDDTVPFLDVCTGVEVFAEAFGCRVHRPQADMPFALPCVGSAAEAEKLEVPAIDAYPLAELWKIADELRHRAGPEPPVRLPDMQSPMGVVALIWNKNDLYRALVEAPEAVKELSAKVASLLTAFLDEWFGRYGCEYIAHYPDYFMSGGWTVSEDEVGAVSTEMFEEFFRPQLEALSQRYGGIGLHCCAHARHQWEHFRRLPDLRVLNLVQPPEVIREAYGVFADSVVQYHSWLGEGPPWTWPEQYRPGSRVVLEASATSREEAMMLSERLWAACGRGGRC